MAMSSDGTESVVGRRSAMAVLSTGLVTLAAAAQPASARGRGTQEAVAQRLFPRIVKLREYLKNDIDAMIDSGDFTAMEAAAAYEENKEKKGRRVGPIANGELAMDLWASTFSETFVSEKSSELRNLVQVIRENREALYDISLRGAGKAKAEGGFLGFGAKPPAPESPEKLRAQAQAAANNIRAAFDKFVDGANDGAPLTINALARIGA